MKTCVSRILKKIYFTISTSRLDDAVAFRDFSEYNLFQIMSERLP